jgi:hypothetical protein
MSDMIKTYMLATCQFVWNGIDMSSGVGSDTVLDAKRVHDLVTTKGNARGDTANSKNINKQGTIEFTLMANSAVNGLLTAAYLAQENIQEDYWSNFTVIDPSNSRQMTAINCWFVKAPDMTKAQESGEVTWSFGCHQLDFIPLPA